MIDVPALVFPTRRGSPPKLLIFPAFFSRLVGGTTSSSLGRNFQGCPVFGDVSFPFLPSFHCFLATFRTSSCPRFPLGSHTFIVASYVFGESFHTLCIFAHPFVDDPETGSLPNSLPHPLSFPHFGIVPEHHLSRGFLLTKLPFRLTAVLPLGFTCTHLEGNIIFSPLDFKLIRYRKGWAVEHVVTACCAAHGTPGNSESDPGGACMQK